MSSMPRRQSAWSWVRTSPEMCRTSRRAKNRSTASRKVLPQSTSRWVSRAGSAAAALCSTCSCCCCCCCSSAGPATSAASAASFGAGTGAGLPGRLMSRLGLPRRFLESGLPDAAAQTLQQWSACCPERCASCASARRGLARQLSVGVAVDDPHPSTTTRTRTMGMGMGKWKWKWPLAAAKVATTSHRILAALSTIMSGHNLLKRFGGGRKGGMRLSLAQASARGSGCRPLPRIRSEHDTAHTLFIVEQVPAPRCGRLRQAAGLHPSHPACCSGGQATTTTSCCNSRSPARALQLSATAPHTHHHSHTPTRKISPLRPPRRSSPRSIKHGTNRLLNEGELRNVLLEVRDVVQPLEAVCVMVSTNPGVAAALPRLCAILSSRAPSTCGRLHPTLLREQQLNHQQGKSCG